jgi:hypothetical protein
MYARFALVEAVIVFTVAFPVITPDPNDVTPLKTALFKIRPVAVPPLIVDPSITVPWRYPIVEIPTRLAL